MAGPSVLGTSPATVEVTEFVKAGWFRHAAVPREVGYLDLTVDEVPLRRLLAGSDPDVAPGVTPIGNEWASPAYEADYLRALLGRPVEDEHAVMPDGRAPLLVCHVDFDLDCGARTARVVHDEHEVTWFDVAWQVGYDPLDLAEQDPAVTSLVFRRDEYDAVLLPLLAEALGRV